jgi:hypothetical protein
MKRWASGIDDFISPEYQAVIDRCGWAFATITVTVDRMIAGHNKLIGIIVGGQ